MSKIYVLHKAKRGSDYGDDDSYDSVILFSHTVEQEVRTWASTNGCGYAEIHSLEVRSDGSVEQAYVSMVSEW